MSTNNSGSAVIESIRSVVNDEWKKARKIFCEDDARPEGAEGVDQAFERIYGIKRDDCLKLAYVDYGDSMISCYRLLNSESDKLVMVDICYDVCEIRETDY